MNTWNMLLIRVSVNDELYEYQFPTVSLFFQHSSSFNNVKVQMYITVKHSVIYRHVYWQKEGNGVEGEGRGLWG